MGGSWMARISLGSGDTSEGCGARAPARSRGARAAAAQAAPHAPIASMLRSCDAHSTNECVAGRTDRRRAGSTGGRKGGQGVQQPQPIFQIHLEHQHHTAHPLHTQTRPNHCVPPHAATPIARTYLARDCKQVVDDGSAHRLDPRADRAGAAQFVCDAEVLRPFPRHRPGVVRVPAAQG